MSEETKSAQLAQLESFEQEFCQKRPPPRFAHQDGQQLTESMKKRLSLTKRGSNNSEQLPHKNGAIKATEALEESKEPHSGSSQEDDEPSPFFEQLINGQTSFDASLISTFSLQ